MVEKKVSLHTHAANRLEDRFNADESWLLQELNEGRSVQLKGVGFAEEGSQVRSGHLLYLPEKKEYCIAVMDDRHRLCITVLTEEMGVNSTWGNGITETVKLKAKKNALGKKSVHDANFLNLYAKNRGILAINVRIRTYSNCWDPLIVTLCKIEIKPEQIDLENNSCTLTGAQEEEVIKMVKRRLADCEIQPYGELFIGTTNNKKISIVNEISVVSSLDAAERVRRWL